MLLLVDNDPAFLAQAERGLTAAPIRGILFASNAEQSRNLMRTVGGQFSLVMIDLDLGGEDGFTLIREMSQCFPDLPIVAISGVYKREVLESAKALGAMETLQKPIGPEWNRTISTMRSRAANG